MKKGGSLTKRLIIGLKEKIDNFMDNIIEDLLILFSNEPYWKREEIIQIQTMPTKDAKDYIKMGLIVDFETISSLED